MRQAGLSKAATVEEMTTGSAGSRIDKLTGSEMTDRASTIWDKEIHIITPWAWRQDWKWEAQGSMWLSSSSGREQESRLLLQSWHSWTASPEKVSQFQATRPALCVEPWPSVTCTRRRWQVIVRTRQLAGWECSPGLVSASLNHKLLPCLPFLNRSLDTSTGDRYAFAVPFCRQKERTLRQAPSARDGETGGLRQVRACQAAAWVWRWQRPGRRTRR